MNKVLGICLIAMLCVVPVAFAIVNYFPGLAAPVAAALTGAGVTTVGIGIAVVAGGYVVYHYAAQGWKYYFTNRYNSIDSHAYILHGTEFGTLTKFQFDDKCIKSQNSNSNIKYWQYSDNRLISYNSATKMLTVGDPNGKLVITCFYANIDYVMRQIATGKWVQTKKY